MSERPSRRLAVFDRLPGTIELRSCGLSMSAKLTEQRPTIDVPEWLTGPVQVTYRPEPICGEELGVRRTWVLA
jgi:hypothetical protein